MDTEVTSQRKGERYTVNEVLNSVLRDGKERTTKLVNVKQIMEKSTPGNGEISKENPKKNILTFSKIRESSEQDLSCAPQKSDNKNKNVLDAEACENSHDQIVNTDNDTEDQNNVEQDMPTVNVYDITARRELVDDIANRLEALEAMFPEKLSNDPSDAEAFHQMKLSWFDLRFIIEICVKELFMMQGAEDCISLLYNEYRECFELDEDEGQTTEPKDLDDNSDNRAKLAMCVYCMEQEDKATEQYVNDISWFDNHSIVLFEYLRSSGDSIKHLGYYLLLTSHMKNVLLSRMESYTAKMQLLNCLRKRLEKAVGSKEWYEVMESLVESVDQVPPPAKRSYCIIL